MDNSFAKYLSLFLLVFSNIEVNSQSPNFFTVLGQTALNQILQTVNPGKLNIGAGAAQLVSGLENLGKFSTGLVLELRKISRDVLSLEEMNKLLLVGSELDAGEMGKLIKMAGRVEGPDLVNFFGVVRKLHLGEMREFTNLLLEINDPVGAKVMARVVVKAGEGRQTLSRFVNLTSHMLFTDMKKFVKFADQRLSPSELELLMDVSHRHTDPDEAVAQYVNMSNTLRSTELILISKPLRGRSLAQFLNITYGRNGNDLKNFVTLFKEFKGPKDLTALHEIAQRNLDADFSKFLEIVSKSEDPTPREMVLRSEDLNPDLFSRLIDTSSGKRDLSDPLLHLATGVPTELFEKILEFEDEINPISYRKFVILAERVRKRPRKSNPNIDPSKVPEKDPEDPQSPDEIEPFEPEIGIISIGQDIIDFKDDGLGPKGVENLVRFLQESPSEITETFIDLGYRVNRTKNIPTLLQLGRSMDIEDLNSLGLLTSRKLRRGHFDTLLEIGGRLASFDDFARFLHFLGPQNSAEVNKFIDFSEGLDPGQLSLLQIYFEGPGHSVDSIIQEFSILAPVTPQALPSNGSLDVNSTIYPYTTERGQNYTEPDGSLAVPLKFKLSPTTPDGSSNESSEAIENLTKIPSNFVTGNPEDPTIPPDTTTPTVPDYYEDYEEETTTSTTTLRPMRRRRRRTTTSSTTLSTSFDYYYEEEDETTTPMTKKPLRRRRRTTSSTTASTPIEPDYYYEEEMTTPTTKKPLRRRRRTTTTSPTTTEGTTPEYDYFYEIETTTKLLRRRRRTSTTVPPPEPTTEDYVDFDQFSNDETTTPKRRRRKTTKKPLNYLKPDARGKLKELDNYSDPFSVSYEYYDE